MGPELSPEKDVFPSEGTARSWRGTGETGQVGGRGLGRERREQQRGLFYTPGNTVLVVLQRGCGGEAAAGPVRRLLPTVHRAHSSLRKLPPRFLCSFSHVGYLALG